MRITLILIEVAIAAGILSFFLKTRKEYKKMKLNREKLERVLAIAAEYQDKFSSQDAELKEVKTQLDEANKTVESQKDAVAVLDDQALSDKVDAVIAKDDEIKNPVVEEPAVEEAPVEEAPVEDKPKDDTQAMF